MQNFNLLSLLLNIQRYRNNPTLLLLYIHFIYKLTYFTSKELPNKKKIKNKKIKKMLSIKHALK